MFDTVEIIIILVTGVACFITGSSVTTWLYVDERKRWDSIAAAVSDERKAMKEAADRIFGHATDDNGFHTEPELPVVNEPIAGPLGQVEPPDVGERPNENPGSKVAFVPEVPNVYVMDYVINPTTRALHTNDCRRAPRVGDPLMAMNATDLAALVESDRLHPCGWCKPIQRAMGVTV